MLKFTKNFSLTKVDFFSCNELDLISPDDREIFNKMIKDLTMSDKKFERNILDNNNLLCPLFCTWKNDLMSSSSLTTIGGYYNEKHL